MRLTWTVTTPAGAAAIANCPSTPLAAPSPWPTISIAASAMPFPVAPSITRPTIRPRGMLAAIQEHWDGKTPFFHSEHRILTQSGSYKWVFTRGRAMRDDYGRHNFGQRLLLARRLVQAGVRITTVTDGAKVIASDVRPSASWDAVALADKTVTANGKTYTYGEVLGAILAILSIYFMRLWRIGPFLT